MSANHPLLTRRQNAQFSAPRRLSGVLDVLKYFVAVQGQEYEQTKWGLSLRCDARDAEIENALNSGEILRTHLLRPTWHFVSKDDLGWLLALTAPQVHQANKYMYKKLELAPVLSRATGLITDALSEGFLTREELQGVLKSHGITAEGHRLSYLMMHAELEGLIASGPRRGKEFTYRLWEKSTPLPREEALSLLARRYFTSRGPATLADFSTWSGLSMADVKTGAAGCGRDLERWEVSGDLFYALGSDDKSLPDELLLLPIYDEYIMGYKHRSMYFSSDSVLTYDGMVVLNGSIVGTWKRTLGKKNRVFLALGSKLGPRQGLLDAALARFERFYGTPIELRHEGVIAKSKNSLGTNSSRNGTIIANKEPAGMPPRHSLLEHGFSYLVLRDFAHLTKGTSVRLLEAGYHQAPKSDEGGYILRFSDRDYVALDHIADHAVIEAIGQYLQKGQPFDWEEGMAQYGAAFREGHAEYHRAVRDENHEQNDKASAEGAKLVAQGFSPKDAYQKYLKRLRG